MFPFFNPGSVNPNGNPPSASMQQQQQQQPMMNPGNFPLNPMQFQQQTINPQMNMPFNYPVFPFQQAPMNFNQFPQNSAQLLNQNMLMGLGFPNQMQGLNPFFQMQMQMPNFNSQVLPGNLNMPQNLAFNANNMMGFGNNCGRPQISTNSNVSNQMLNANTQQGVGVQAFDANNMMGFGNNGGRPQLSTNSNVSNQMLNANTQQVGIGVQAFAPLPLQNTPQNFHCAAGQPQGNNTNPPPQRPNNHIGVSQHNNSFVRNTNQQGSQNRFIKQQGQANRNPKFQKFQSKAGNHDVQKSSFANSVKTPQAEKRSIPLNYTEQEIKQWREARQKNYPTKANIEKLKEKLKDPEISKKDAVLRGQELKEILAKQAELGCEVAEIPSSYFSDSQRVVGMKDNVRRSFNENDRRVRFKQNNDNFRNNRRPWNQNDRFSNNRQNNRQRVVNGGDSASHDTENKREPTLLRKLLQTDIKRDKSYLLQVFRAMVMNSFFEDWPEKPLKFPQVIVREIVNEDEYNNNSKNEESVENDGVLDKKIEIPDSNENLVVSVVEKEEGGNQEEGEITD